MKYLSIILLFGLYACYSPGKAIQKAYDNAPEKVAEFTRDKFPCTDLKADTTILYRDSVIMVECPTNATETDTGNVRGIIYAPKITWTGGKYSARYIPDTTKSLVPVKIPVRTVTITKTVEDSAKIYLAIADKDKAVKAYEDEADRRKSLLKWFWWLLLAFIVSLVGNYLQLKKWL